MATIGNQAKIEAISALAQQMFGEGEQLEQFVLRLGAEIFSKNEETKNKQKKAGQGSSKSIASKKSMNQEDRCDAYIFAVVKNEETGEFEPKQCSRSHEEGSKFCKKHGSVHGKRDDAASNYHGKDVFYEFKWQLHGSVENGPTFVFEKFRDQLLAKFNQQTGGSDESSGNESDDSAPKKKNSKIAAPKKEKTKAVKPTKKANTAATKRSKNPYFEYLSAERENIKAELIAENSELKGRELVTSITKEAGKRWKEMSDEDRQPYMEVASLNDSIQVGDSQINETIHSGDQVVSDSSTHSSIHQQEETPCCDDHDSSVQQEEEETDRIFNETHKVWVDSETQLYYETEKSETPLGQIVRGKMTPFKTKK